MRTLPRRHGLLAATVLAAALAVAGCSGATLPSAPAGAITDARTVTVFAAASMRSTFTTLGTTFEAAHPGVTVAFNFAGSQALADQLEQGASADVFASADAATMARAVRAGLTAGKPAVYATNRLSIAVPPDNPAGVATFSDLAKPGLKLVVCAPAVPCGAATAKVAEATGTTLRPVSEEQAVTDVLAKVQAGEADAGIVYVTDVLSAKGAVKGIDFPEAALAITSSSIVALDTGGEAALGKEFVDLVLSPEGRRVLAEAGFGAAG